MFTYTCVWSYLGFGWSKFKFEKKELFVFNFSTNVDLAERHSFIRLGMRTVWSYNPQFLISEKKSNFKIEKQVRDEQRCVLDEIRWGRGWGRGRGRGWGRWWWWGWGLIAHLLWTIEDDYQAHFSRIHCFEKSGYGPTDRRTDQPTEGQSLL